MTEQEAISVLDDKVIWKKIIDVLDEREINRLSGAVLVARPALREKAERENPAALLRNVHVGLKTKEEAITASPAARRWTVTRMLKPVACKCGSLPSVLGEKGAYECACLARYPFCENTTLIVAKTRLGAILRWNLWAWREKMSGGYHGAEIDADEYAKKAFAAMKEIYDLSVSPADNWIPCAEGLPKEHKRGMIMCSDLVEVTVKNSKGTIYTAVDYTVNGKWETYEVMETGCTVLAWQPLPAPWAGEKKGEADGK